MMASSSPLTPTGLVSSPIPGDAGLVATPRSFGANAMQFPTATASATPTGSFVTEAEVDILFELQEVTLQEIDVSGGIPMLPHPQLSPLIITSIASPSSSSQTAAAAASSMMLLGNYKLILSPDTAVIQLSRFVFDFMLPSVFPAISGNAARTASVGVGGAANSDATVNSADGQPAPLLLQHRRCVRVMLPLETPRDDLENFPAVVACYVGRVRLARPSALTSVERESLIVGGGGICDHHHSAAAAAAATFASPNRGVGGEVGGGVVSTFVDDGSFSPTSTVIATNVSYYGRLAAGYINRGANIAVNSIGQTTDYVVASTAPCETPVVVPAAVKSTIEGGRAVAQTAANFTGGVASAMIGAAGYVGSYAGTAISRAFTGAGDGGGGATVSDSSIAQYIGANVLPPVAEVGSAVIGSGALVFSTFVDAQQSLVDAAKSNVARVATHKMGPEVGEATAGVMETAALGAEVAFVASSKKVKRTAILMAAKVAKQAAEGAVDGHKRLEQENMTLALRPGGGGVPLAIRQKDEDGDGIMSGTDTNPSSRSTSPSRRRRAGSPVAVSGGGAGSGASSPSSTSPRHGATKIDGSASGGDDEVTLPTPQSPKTDATKDIFAQQASAAATGRESPLSASALFRAPPPMVPESISRL